MAPNSPGTDQIDTLLWIGFVAAAILIVAVNGALIYAVRRYRGARGSQPSEGATGRRNQLRVGADGRDHLEALVRRRRDEGDVAGDPQPAGEEADQDVYGVGRAGQAAGPADDLDVLVGVVRLRHPAEGDRSLS